MHAHLADLRAEVGSRPDGERWLASLCRSWRTADLDARSRALGEFAARLTLQPGLIREADVAALRDVGLEDGAIHDAAQIVGYFNYINRVAAATDVELEPDMPARTPIEP